MRHKTLRFSETGISSGTPEEAIGKYNAAFNEILSSAPVKEQLAKQGIVAGGGSPEKLRDFIPAEMAKWQKVVKESGITPATDDHSP